MKVFRAVGEDCYEISAGLLIIVIDDVRHCEFNVLV